MGHVSLEDPRANFLLGQLAVALRDRKLLEESKAFLQFFVFLGQFLESGIPLFYSNIFFFKIFN